MKTNNKAFTLVELLVVVLIIGILAAIAVPQYQKAIMKSRLAELDVVFATGRQAIDAFLLAHGLPETTTMFTGTKGLENKGLLDIELPGTPCSSNLNCIKEIGGYDIGCTYQHCGITFRTTRSVNDETEVINHWLGGESVGIEWYPTTGWILVSVPVEDLKARKIICEWWKGDIGNAPRSSTIEIQGQDLCEEVGVSR